MGCLSENTIQELVGGVLPDDAHAQAHLHIETCAACRMLVIELARDGDLESFSLRAGSADVAHRRLAAEGFASTGRPQRSRSGDNPAVSWEAPGEVEEYRIIRPLGAGSMGIVFLAHDTLLDRAVAIKFVSALEVSAGKRERFFTEARAVARLSHPNVVTVYRVGEVRERPYLVSEYVRGTSLAALTEPVASPRALRIAIGLARGLGAAHRRGVLHRDIKPANIILGTGDEPKLLDFGLAKLLRPDATVSLSGSPTAPPRSGPDTADAPPASSVNTADGAIVGTPLYLAPELWRGTPASAASDVYSLGVVIYELLTGQAPHAGLALPELAVRAQAEDAAPIASRVANLPPRLASLVDACISRDPSRRPGSGDALCELLEAIAQPHASSVSVPRAEPSVLDAADMVGERRRVAVLYCDLRGFGAFSDTGRAAEVIDRLNQYFDSMAAAITAHGGAIDKFIGDAVLAVFGAIPLVNPAEAALDAALAMRRALHALNQGWLAAGLAPLDNGIGLEFGEVLYGSVGSAGRRAVTVLGEVVYTALLLESKTRQLGTPILLSEALAVALPPARRPALAAMGEVELRRSVPPRAVFGVAG